MIHFCLNDTSTRPDGSLIAGGQLDRYFAPVRAALDGMGIAYTVGRQPAEGAVNVYPNTRATYRSGSARLDRASVGVSHGIADKTYCGGYRYYTCVVVPGQAHAEVLARRSRFPERKLRVLGYPKLDPLWRREVDGSDVWSGDGRVRVLYAPTHGGGSERHRDGNRKAPGAGATSWWHRDQVAGLLDPEVFEVVLAPHPRHAEGRQATYAQYVDAQVVVADGGSTIYEGLLLGLPVVLPAWLTRPRNQDRARGLTLEAEVYRTGVGYQVDDPAAFADTVARAAAEGPKPGDAQFAARVVAPEHRGTSGALWAQLLADVDEQAPPWRPRRGARRTYLRVTA